MSRDRDLDDEVEAHLAEAVDEYVARGLSAKDARYAALRDFGGVTQVKQVHREMRGFTFMNWLDFKLGGRMLVKYPGLTIVGGFAMAFAILVGIVIFQFAGLFIYPSLPLANGDRIVALGLQDVAQNEEEPKALFDFISWKESLRTVDQPRRLARCDPHPDHRGRRCASGLRRGNVVVGIRRCRRTATDRTRAHARRRTTRSAGGCRDWSRAVEDTIRRRSKRPRTHGSTWRRSPDDRGRDARALRVPGVARDVGAAEDRPSRPDAAFRSCHHGLRHPDGRPDAGDGASGVDDAWAPARCGTEVHARASRTARGGIREHDGHERL